VIFEKTHVFRKKWRFQAPSDQVVAVRKRRIVALRIPFHRLETYNFDAISAEKYILRVKISVCDSVAVKVKNNGKCGQCDIKAFLL
jgi:hypothetical protein